MSHFSYHDTGPIRPVTFGSGASLLPPPSTVTAPPYSVAAPPSPPPFTPPEAWKEVYWYAACQKLERIVQICDNNIERSHRVIQDLEEIQARWLSGRTEIPPLPSTSDSPSPPRSPSSPPSLDLQQPPPLPSAAPEPDLQPSSAAVVLEQLLVELPSPTFVVEPREQIPPSPPSIELEPPRNVELLLPLVAIPTPSVVLQQPSSLSQLIELSPAPSSVEAAQPTSLMGKEGDAAQLTLMGQWAGTQAQERD